MVWPLASDHLPWAITYPWHYGWSLTGGSTVVLLLFHFCFYFQFIIKMFCSVLKKKIKWIHFQFNEKQNNFTRFCRFVFNLTIVQSKINNCNVFVCVTLAYVFQVSILTVLNFNVSCYRVSLKHTLKKKGRAFRNIGKYTSLTVKSALLFFETICLKLTSFCRFDEWQLSATILCWGMLINISLDTVIFG